MLVFYQILVTTRLFEKNEALILTLLATLVPYNFARITVACARYGLCYLLFLVAFLLVVKYMSSRRVVTRVAALILFFVSFDTNSLLLFYIIALAYIAYRERDSLRSLRDVVRKCVEYIDFLLLPLVYYAVKTLFFVPYGIYADYNSISAQNIDRSPYEFLLVMRHSFVGVIWGSLTTAASALVASALLIFLTYWLVGRRVQLSGEAARHGSAARRFWLGVLLLYAGVLPYLAIGRDGATFGLEWESRDQLLLGIGAAFVLYYALDYLSKRLRLGPWPARAVFVLLIAAFIVTNMTVYLAFQADWFKQVAIVENVEDLPVVKDNATFTVQDNAGTLNAMGRHIQFYEYNGMLKQAFGDETRLAAWTSDIGGFADPGFLALCVERPQYNFKDYAYVAPMHTIVIDGGVGGRGPLGTVRLLAKQIFDPAAFREDVKRVVSVRVEPVEQVVAPAQ
jgi:hypothetical protein